MTTVLTQPNTLGDWLKAEYCDKNFSRKAITLASSGTAREIKTGTVLGKVTVGTASETHAGNTGNGTMGTITVGAGAVPGVYRLRIVAAESDAGDFQVSDPSGNLVGVGKVGVAYSSGGLSFTLADGSANFIVGDTFLITVAAGSGKHKEINFSATDGTQIADAIAMNDETVPASGDLASTGLCRGPATIVTPYLTWPDGATAAQKAAALAKLAEAGIVTGTSI